MYPNQNNFNPMYAHNPFTQQQGFVPMNNVQNPFVQSPSMQGQSGVYNTGMQGYTQPMQGYVQQGQSGMYVQGQGQYVPQQTMQGYTQQGMYNQGQNQYGQGQSQYNQPQNQYDQSGQYEVQQYVEYDQGQPAQYTQQQYDQMFQQGQSSQSGKMTQQYSQPQYTHPQSQQPKVKQYDQPQKSQTVQHNIQPQYTQPPSNNIGQHSQTVNPSKQYSYDTPIEHVDIDRGFSTNPEVRRKRPEQYEQPRPGTSEYQPSQTPPPMPSRNYSSNNPFAKNIDSSMDTSPPTIPSRENTAPPIIPSRENSTPSIPDRIHNNPPSIPNRDSQWIEDDSQKRPMSVMEKVQDRIQSAYVKKISVISAQHHLILVHDDPSIQNVAIERNGNHPGNFTEAIDTTDIVGRTHKGYGVLGIITISQESFLILITDVDAVGSFRNSNCYRITGTKFLPFNKRNESLYGPQAPDKPPYYSVQKFINMGPFYFSYEYNLTMSLQKQQEFGDRLQNKPMWKSAEKSFFWNRYLTRHFVKKRLHGWVCVVIRGYISFSHEQCLPNSQIRGYLGLISRISCDKTGTRFNSRGIDDDGNVANFVETEQILVANNGGEIIYSYVEIRGSVPVFWEQKLIKGKHKMKISRGADATTPASLKHFDSLRDEYNHIHVVNLLSQKGNSETELSNAYSEQFIRYPHCQDFDFSLFDFHEVCGNKHFDRVNQIFDSIDVPIRRNFIDYGYFTSVDGEVITRQNGVFRTNCLDCLDRTNVVQGVIAKEALITQLIELGVLDQNNRNISEFSSFGKRYKNVWADNGDNLSIAYAGTGAMKSSYTRTGKRTIGGMFDDGLKSAKRMYINNFKDDGTQESIDYFLGNIEEEMELRDEDMWVSSQLKFRKPLYSETEQMNIFVGSWNINTFVPNMNTDLSPFISPMQGNETKLIHDEIELYVFGFQEIVELNGNNMVQASEENLRAWQQVLLAKINSERERDNQIVLAKSEQLVGIAVVIFVKKSLAGNLRNVKFQHVKSGVRGLAGNKGAICARFDIKDTSVFVACCHIAAGQSKTEQRIRDIQDISAVKFRHPECPKMSDHDYIIWMGDFNFRVSLTREEADHLVNVQQWHTLLEYDQYTVGRREGWYFSDYTEAAITFPPTYKYDINSDLYDTSEKQRVPSWCDRILYKANDGNMESLLYNRCELYQSDHRPVKSAFRIQVTNVDKKALSKMEKNLYKITATLDEDVIQNYHMPYGVDDAITLLDDNFVLEEASPSVVILEYLESINLIIQHMPSFANDPQRLKSATNLLNEIIRKITSTLSIHNQSQLAETISFSFDSFIENVKRYVEHSQPDTNEFQDIIQIVRLISTDLQSYIENEINS